MWNTPSLIWIFVILQYSTSGLIASQKNILPTNVNDDETLIPRACSDEYKSFAFCNTSLSILDRVQYLIKELTLKEKVAMLTARSSHPVKRLGIPEYDWGANCVHGVQSTCGTNCATNFPNPVNLGAMFNTELVQSMADIIGWELRALWLEKARENYKAGPHVGLDCWSPNININRDPRWGRNMETPSEDPLINGRYGVAYTRGLQEGRDPKYLQAVVTLKHWAAYSFDRYEGIDRMEFNAIVSKYDFADTYIPAFRTSIKDGKAKGIMCSYNLLNGMPMCANYAMNMKLLRKEFGFDGYITSDSGALEGMWRKRHYTKSLCEAGRLAIESGTDINSGSVYHRCLENLVLNRTVDEKYIDAALNRSLSLRFELGLFDPIEDQIYWHAKPSDVGANKSVELSLTMARQSLILLQNHASTLPMQVGTRLAVLGPHYAAKGGMMGNYYGQICHGDYKELGCVETPIEAISRLNTNGITKGAAGCGVNSTSAADFHAAMTIAQESDVVVLFLGIDTTIEAEVADRTTIELPGQQLKLLKSIYTLGKPTTVVLFNGGIIGSEEIIAFCDALIEAFYPGKYGAQAIAEVLFGQYNPGGKLPVTMYRSKYIESVKMGSMDMTTYPGRTYKYFKEVPVFPFGYGLSYTTFALSAPNNTNFTSTVISDTDDLSKPIELSIDVQNTGNHTGDEVVFLFFRPLAVNVTGPAKTLNQQLLDFQRVSLKTGEKKIVNLHFAPSDLGLHDSEGNCYLYPGFYELLITNGVAERYIQVIHVKGPQQLIRHFPLTDHKMDTSHIDQLQMDMKYSNVVKFE